MSYALALTSREGLAAYVALRRILRACLTSSQRQGLAWAALEACDPDEAQGVVENLFEIDTPAGPPDTFDCTDPVDDAAWWAGTASEIELRAYAMACLARVPAGERRAMVAAPEKARSMSEPLVDAWAEVVRLPRGRAGQGQPGWQPVIREITARGLRRTWPNAILTNRAGGLARRCEAGTEIRLQIRSADVVLLHSRTAT